MNERGDELIREIEQTYGWVSDSRPRYVERSEKLLPEEGDTQAQRELAFRVVSGLEQGYHVPPGIEPKINPQIVLDAYETHKGGTLMRGVDTKGFSLNHVIGEIQRRINWFQQLKGHDETSLYDIDIEHLKLLKVEVTAAINIQRKV